MILCFKTVAHFIAFKPVAVVNEATAAITMRQVFKVLLFFTILFDMYLAFANTKLNTYNANTLLVVSLATRTHVLKFLKLFWSEDANTISIFLAFV